MSVAYALLRKPMLENLLHLEWLAADTEGMLQTFYNEDVEHRDLSRLRNPHRSLGTIKKALDNIPCGEWFDPEFIFELRYDKNSSLGLDALCNKAMHLVTTKHQAIRTEKQNFNFIFSGEEARQSQLDGYYLVMPTLLLYFVSICEYLTVLTTKEVPPDHHEFVAWTALGLAMHCICEAEEGFDEERLHEMCPFKCKACSAPLARDAEAILSLLQWEPAPCQACGSEISLSDISKQ